MADEFTSSDRRGLIELLGDVKAKRAKISREELDADLTELSLAIYAKQEQAERQLAQLAAIVRAQNTAILRIEAASLRGRIRRQLARLAAWRELLASFVRRPRCTCGHRPRQHNRDGQPYCRVADCACAVYGEADR